MKVSQWWLGVVLTVAMGTAWAGDRTIDAAVELLDAMRFEQQMTAIKDALVPMMKQQERVISQEFGRELNPAAQAVMDRYMESVAEIGFSPEMLNEFRLDAAAVYANVFSAEELEAMTAFYRSPIGQSMLEKTPEVSRQMMHIMSETQQELTRQMIPLIQEMQADLKRAMEDGR